MTFAQREKFHDFARKILIWMFLAALRLVQPNQHGRVFADFDQHLQPVARSQAAEQLILPPHEVRLFDFLETGGEVTVPKEHHFLLQRPRPMGHPLQPPTAQFHDVLTLLLLFLAEYFAPLLLTGPPGRQKSFCPRWIRLGPRRIGSVIGNLLEID